MKYTRRETGRVTGAGEWEQVLGQWERRALSCACASEFLRYRWFKIFPHIWKARKFAIWYDDGIMGTLVAEEQACEVVRISCLPVMGLFNLGMGTCSIFSESPKCCKTMGWVLIQAWVLPWHFTVPRGYARRYKCDIWIIMCTASHAGRLFIPIVCVIKIWHTRWRCHMLRERQQY